MQLTKTDFIQYLNCPKSLWVLKHDPDSYPHGEFSVFLQKLVREGFEVERYAQWFFKSEGREVEFQRAFETKNGLFARVDALERAADGQTILYEIKSSTSVKTEDAHNHLKDACFQKICAERAGQRVDRIYIVHLNGTYVRDGKVDPTGLLTFVDVTDKVNSITQETEREIDAALDILAKAALDGKGCSCLQKSRGHHCDTFKIFNPGMPVPSIYSLPRLTEKKREDLIAKGILDLLTVPDDYALSPSQTALVSAAKSGAPQIDLKAIAAFLKDLQFPLHFFDFETYGSAVPIMDRTSPHKQFPVQYSLHVLTADGSLTHHEYLEREKRLPGPLIERMRADIGAEGSILSWHASFEAGQNKEMAKLFPDAAAFLSDVNGRLEDLEDLFKTAYVDARFDGSTSIKKVLPVICPDLNYEDLDIGEGASAMEAWERLIAAPGDQAARIANSLLRYCERDTLAMVRIYLFLKALIGTLTPIEESRTAVA